MSNTKGYLMFIISLYLMAHLSSALNSHVCMHTCTSTHAYAYICVPIFDPYQCMHTHTQILDDALFPMVSVHQQLWCCEWHFLCPLSTTGWSWFCRERAQPHTVIVTDICGQDTEVHLNHVCLAENAHSCTCFNGVSAACGFPLIDVGITASRALGVKGSGLCSKQLVEPRTFHLTLCTE